MNDEKIVLSTSDEAAKFVTGLSGWVSRNGRFWGNDERMARYDGCTHTVCDCGKPVEKGWLKCTECRNKANNELFAGMKKEVWDGETPLTLYDGDEYFFDWDSLACYCEDHGTTPEEVGLLLCKPTYASEIDPNEYYCDDLAEDGEVDSGLVEKFNELNKYIRENKIILSWTPSDIVAIIEAPHD
ncbi:MAG: hypothetical protein WAX33_04400 [Rectinemataceae bacterium]